MPERLRVAMAGNPNSGKTTIFNALTGGHQRVANYPGVTVEAKEGIYTARDGTTVELTDLPGAYSLSACTPDELVACQALIDSSPDAVLCVLDSSTLERGLYLATQVADLGVPCVVALNMSDEAERSGRAVDRERLAELLGMPVVPTVATAGKGLDELMAATLDAARAGRGPKPLPLGRHVEEALGEILDILRGTPVAHSSGIRFLAMKLLEGDQLVSGQCRSVLGPERAARINEVRNALRSHLGDDPEALVADGRYGLAAGIARQAIKPTAEQRVRLSEHIDAWVAHRVLGVPILCLATWLLFETVFRLGAPAMHLLELGFQGLAGLLNSIMPESAVRSLITEAIIGGVGGILVFLPQVLLLFLGIALLEDTGYMARAAFVMDRLMQAIGLHGKSFIPMLLGFGCSVPAVLATRTLADPKDRITTILVIPLMSCSARLPVYALLTAAFFQPEHGALVVLSLYVLGVLVACAMARVFRSTLFRGESAPFVMELPPYRVPTWRSLLSHMWERAWLYLKKAGTVILVMSVVLWVLCSYPRPPADASPDASPLTYTVAGRVGRVIEPALSPLGFDYKLGVALFTGLAAKEVVVSSLATMYQVDESRTEGGLRQALRADPALNPLVAYAFMVFVLTYIPCAPTVVTVSREAGGWRWAALLVAYTTALAWVLTLVVYQVGRLVTGLP